MCSRCDFPILSGIAKALCCMGLRRIEVTFRAILIVSGEISVEKG